MHPLTRSMLGQGEWEFLPASRAPGTHEAVTGGVPSLPLSLLPTPQFPGHLKQRHHILPWEARVHLQIQP